MDVVRFVHNGLRSGAELDAVGPAERSEPTFRSGVLRENVSDARPQDSAAPASTGR
jgi:hypothetical protein